MSLEQSPKSEKKERSFLENLRKRIGLPLALAAGLTAHEPAKAVDVTAKSYEGGVSQLREGAVYDRVETKAYHIQTENGKGTWYSYEGETASLNKRFVDFRSDLLNELLALNPHEGEVIEIASVHTHPLAAIEHSWPDIITQGQGSSPPSIEYFDPKTDTSLAGVISRRTHLFSWLEYELEGHGLPNVKVIPKTQVVDSLGIWNYSRIESEEWKKRHPDLNEMFIEGSVYAKKYDRMFAKLQGDNFLMNRITKVAMEEQVETDVVLLRWMRVLYSATKNHDLGTFINAFANKRHEPPLDHWTLDVWSDKFMFEFLLVDVIPSRLGSEIFDNTEHADFFNVHQKVFAGISDPVMNASREKLFDIRKRWVEASLTTPIDELHESRLYDELVAAYELAGVKLSYTPFEVGVTN